MKVDRLFRSLGIPPKLHAQLRTHPISAGLLPTRLGIFTRYRKHVVERPVNYPDSIVIYCIEGRGLCHVRGRTWTVHPHEWLMIPAGERHGYRSTLDDPWTIAWFCTDASALTCYFKLLELSPAHPVLSARENPRFLGFFEEALDALENGLHPMNCLTAASALHHLMTLLVTQHCTQPPRQNDTAERIGRTITAMREHLDQPVKVSRLAAMSRWSVSQYTALFKRQTGHPPLDFFIRLRMQSACQLLDTSTLTVKEIAHQLGYEDPYHFSRVFKSVMEQSPQHYRMRQSMGKSRVRPHRC